jgi:Ca2+-binding EF-hand superfamily protein
MRDTQADQTLKVMLSSAEFVTKSEVSEALRMAMGGDGPVPSHLIDNVMNVIDTNHDGSVSRDEFNTYMRVFKKLETLKSQADQCALRIISVNDVYEITNFPALHNLILDNKVRRVERLRKIVAYDHLSAY